MAVSRADRHGRINVGVKYVRAESRNAASYKTLIMGDSPLSECTPGSSLPRSDTAD